MKKNQKLNEHLLRRRMTKFTNLMEIVISVIVLIALFISMWPLLQGLPMLTSEEANSFQSFLGHAFNLVIGIEFIKMLCKHSPGSALEVLLYAIARHMLIDRGSSLDNLLSVIAIGLVFVIRKFCFIHTFEEQPSDEILEAQTSGENDFVDYLDN